MRCGACAGRVRGVYTHRSMRRVSRCSRCMCASCRERSLPCGGGTGGSRGLLSRMQACPQTPPPPPSSPHPTCGAGGQHLFCIADVVVIDLLEASRHAPSPLACRCRLVLPLLEVEALPGRQHAINAGGLFSSLAALLGLLTTHRLNGAIDAGWLPARRHRTRPPSLHLCAPLLRSLLLPRQLEVALFLRLDPLGIVDHGAAKTGLGHVGAGR